MEHFAGSPAAWTRSATGHPRWGGPHSPAGTARQTVLAADQLVASLAQWGRLYSKGPCSRQRRRKEKRNERDTTLTCRRGRVGGRRGGRSSRPRLQPLDFGSTLRAQETKAAEEGAWKNAHGANNGKLTRKRKVGGARETREDTMCKISSSAFLALSMPPPKTCTLEVAPSEITRTELPEDDLRVRCVTIKTPVPRETE